MRTFLSNETSGYGKPWMDKNVGEVNFKIDTFPSHVASAITNQPTSIVIGNTVHFTKDFTNTYAPERHVVHEVSHAIDSKMAGRLATVIGGGPADELVKFVGGSPHGIRFVGSNFVVPEEYLFRKPHDYGNKTFADYFAQSIAVWMYDPRGLPPKVGLWLQAVVDLTK